MEFFSGIQKGVRHRIVILIDPAEFTNRIDVGIGRNGNIGIRRNLESALRFNVGNDRRGGMTIARPQRVADRARATTLAGITANRTVRLQCFQQCFQNRTGFRFTFIMRVRGIRSAINAARAAKLHVRFIITLLRVVRTNLAGHTIDGRTAQTFPAAAGTSGIIHFAFGILGASSASAGAGGIVYDPAFKTTLRGRASPGLFPLSLGTIGASATIPVHPSQADTTAAARAHSIRASLARRAAVNGICPLQTAIPVKIAALMAGLR